MKIALLCIRDNCNRTSKMERALNTVKGVQAMGLSRLNHPFKYVNPLKIGSNMDFKILIKWADVVWLPMGDIDLFRNFKNLFENKKIIVTHSGTKYRLNSAKFNNIFNQFTTAHILLGHDHMKLGAKNIHYNSLRIIEPATQPKASSERIKIGHFPSNPEKKGTKKIQAVLKELKDEGYKFNEIVSTYIVPHEINMERMGRCDVYIDQLKPTQNGVVFGEVGNQTYEAMSLGCITISNLTDSSYYNKTHGKPIQLIANSTDELKQSLISLIKLSPKELYEKRLETYQAVHDRHGLKAMGKSIYKTLCQIGF